MKRTNAGWWFVAPALAVIAIFFALPVLAALAVSFTDFDIYALADLGNLRFVGLRNYARLLETPLFWQALLNTLYFVAVLNGEVVGGAGVAPLSAADPLTCELERMYLRQDARHRGIGHALLERCIVAAKQFLYVRCYLETVTEMRDAVEFYGRHGFQDLQAPLGEATRRHHDRWMMKALRASARATIRPVAPAMLPARAPHGVARA